jgi:hypothetical protein
MRRKLQQILAEYGPAAVVVYLTIFFVVLFAAWAGINLGWQPESLTGNVGAFTAAYLTTKITYPLRIVGTIARTPFASRLFGRLTRRVGGGPAER